jgi:small redox-active disulfide protein 2
MLAIIVLGSGCPNCQRLEQMAKEAIRQLGVEAEIDKVTDHHAIVAAGVLSTPGLVINEQVVSSGRIPALEEIISWLADAMATA